MSNPSDIESALTISMPSPGPSPVFHDLGINEYVDEVSPGEEQPMPIPAILLGRRRSSRAARTAPGKVLCGIAAIRSGITGIIEEKTSSEASLNRALSGSSFKLFTSGEALAERVPQREMPGMLWVRANMKEDDVALSRTFENLAQPSPAATIAVSDHEQEDMRGVENGESVKESAPEEAEESEELSVTIVKERAAKLSDRRRSSSESTIVRAVSASTPVLTVQAPAEPSPSSPLKNQVIDDRMDDEEAEKVRELFAKYTKETAVLADVSPDDWLPKNPESKRKASDFLQTPVNFLPKRKASVVIESDFIEAIELSNAMQEGIVNKLQGITTSANSSRRGSKRRNSSLKSVESAKSNFVPALARRISEDDEQAGDAIYEDDEDEDVVDPWAYLDTMVVPETPVPRNTPAPSMNRGATQKPAEPIVKVYDPEGTLFHSCVISKTPARMTLNELKTAALANLNISDFPDEWDLRYRDESKADAVIDATQLVVDLKHEAGAAGVVNFRLVRREDYSWTLTVGARGSRHPVVVTRNSTAQDVVAIICEIEEIDEDDMRLYSLWHVSGVEGPAEFGKFLNPDDLPFIPWDKTSTWDLKKGSAKQYQKLASFLGVEDTKITNIVGQESASGDEVQRKQKVEKNEKLSKLFGGAVEIPKEEKQSKLGKMFSIKTLSRGSSRDQLSIRAPSESSLASADSKDSKEEKKGGMFSKFLGAREDPSKLPRSGSMSKLKTTFKESRFNPRNMGKKASADDSSESGNDSKSDENIRGRASQDEPIASPQSPPGHINYKIYFGNMTYTTVCVPDDAVAADVKKKVMKKVSITEAANNYGLFYCSPNAESSVADDDKIADLFTLAAKKQIVLFKKRALKNCLRLELDEEATGVRRNHKLTNFFGTSGDGADRRNSNLSVIVAEPGAVQTQEIHAERVQKQGWLLLDDKDKKKWRNCWCSLAEGNLEVAFGENDEVLATGGASVRIPIIDATVGDDIVLVNKRPAFTFFTKKDEKWTFAAVKQETVTEWIRTLAAASKHDYVLPLVPKVSSPIKLLFNDTEDDNSLLKKSPSFKPRQLSAGESSIPHSESNGSTYFPTSSPVSIADFTILRLLGRGKTSEVVLCKLKDTNELFAVKVITLAGDDENMITTAKKAAANENRILRNIDHPFIVRLHYAFQARDQLFIALDYQSGGDLFFHVSNFGALAEDRARFYAAELLLAVQCLHGKGIIYKDIKLENILIGKDGHIKIADFGFSNVVDEPKKEASATSTTTKRVVGVLEYLSPEVIKGEPFSYAADWWSYGVVLFEMLAGYHPFWNQDRREIRKNILSATIAFPAAATAAAQDIVRRLLTREPQQRLGARGGHEIEEHAFFAGLSFHDVFKKRVTPPYVPDLSDDLDAKFFYNADESFSISRS